jgi:hypothetical protein
MTAPGPPRAETRAGVNKQNASPINISRKADFTENLPLHYWVYSRNSPTHPKQINQLLNPSRPQLLKLGLTAARRLFGTTERAHAHHAALSRRQEHQDRLFNYVLFRNGYALVLRSRQMIQLIRVGARPASGIEPIGSESSVCF